jgi:hypothetical protein
MATLTWLTALVLAACGKVDGFAGEASPLATVTVQVTGDFEAVRVPGATNERLRVALVWGAQWLPEPFCFLPPESPEAAAVIAAGCRDSFGFVADRVGDEVAVVPGIPVALEIYSLPTADALVGDLTARIAYASLVVYDDRNASEHLELGRARGVPDIDEIEPLPNPLERDVVYGASFVSMTEPDVRVALREGDYNPRAAFYPRAGCGEPPPGFSVVGAGGFTPQAAIAATLAGMLPQQDPATCWEADPASTTIPIPFRAVAEVQEVGCVGRRADSSVRYNDPEPAGIDLDGRTFACAGVPDFGTGETDGIVQLVVATRPEERCKRLSHYLLRGCEDDPACPLPEWDLSATPPAWWPCAP